jgi:hypothetical protein
MFPKDRGGCFVVELQCHECLRGKSRLQWLGGTVCKGREFPHSLCEMATRILAHARQRTLRLLGILAMGIALLAGP